jgi:hypothetical protein
MLRRFSHIILSVILLTATMGMAVSKHFCSGTFVSLKLFGESKSCCGDSDCCHNENHFYKLQDDISAAQVQDAPQLAEIDILVSIPGSLELPGVAENNNHIILFTDSPPPPKIQKVLSLKQSYLL